MTRDTLSRRSHLRDDVLREPLEVLDLLVEWFLVAALDVGDAEADNTVGDALVLELAYPFGRVGVVGDGVDLVVVAGVALSLANLGQPRQQPVQLLTVAAGVHPP